MDTLAEIGRRAKYLSPRLQESLLKIIMSWQGVENRGFKRFDLSDDIDVLIGENVVQTSMKNISASGVYIKTSRKIDAEKDVKVVFSIPGMEKPYKLEGKVIRVEPDGLAVEFINSTSYFKTILDDAIWSEEEIENT